MELNLTLCCHLAMSCNNRVLHYCSAVKNKKWGKGVYTVVIRTCMISQTKSLLVMSPAALWFSIRCLLDFLNARGSSRSPSARRLVPQKIRETSTTAWNEAVLDLTHTCFSSPRGDIYSVKQMLSVGWDNVSQTGCRPSRGGLFTPEDIWGSAQPASME